MLAQAMPMPQTYEEIAVNYKLVNDYCSKYGKPCMNETTWLTHIRSRNLKPIVRHLTALA